MIIKTYCLLRYVQHVVKLNNMEESVNYLKNYYFETHYDLFLMFNQSQLFIKNLNLFEKNKPFDLFLYKNRFVFLVDVNKKEITDIRDVHLFLKKQDLKQATVQDLIKQIHITKNEISIFSKQKNQTDMNILKMRYAIELFEKSEIDCSDLQTQLDILIQESKELKDNIHDLKSQQYERISMLISEKNSGILEIEQSHVELAEPFVLHQREDKSIQTKIKTTSNELILTPGEPFYRLISKSPYYVREISYQEALKYLNEKAAYIRQKNTLVKLYNKKTLREFVLQRDNYVCSTCHKEEAKYIRLIVPKSAGGISSPDNSESICSSCKNLNPKSIKALVLKRDAHCYFCGNDPTHIYVLKPTINEGKKHLNNSVGVCLPCLNAPLEIKFRRIDENPYRPKGKHSKLIKICSFCNEYKHRNLFHQGNVCVNCWRNSLNLKKIPSEKKAVPIIAKVRRDAAVVIRNIDYIKKNQLFLNYIPRLQKGVYAQVYLFRNHVYRQKFISRQLAELLLKEGFCKVVSSYPDVLFTLFSQDYPTFRRQIFQRDEGLCRYCGDIGDTIDHIIPISKGGYTSPKNCLLSCKKCNVEKADYVMKY